MKFFKKLVTPWLAEDQFPSREAWRAWLLSCQKTYGTLRMILLVAAVLPLLAGYVLDSHSIMLWTILPLALVLVLSLILGKLDGCGNGQNNQEQ